MDLFCSRGHHAVPRLQFLSRPFLTFGSFLCCLFHNSLDLFQATFFFNVHGMAAAHVYRRGLFLALGFALFCGAECCFSTVGIEYWQLIPNNFPISLQQRALPWAQRSAVFPLPGLFHMLFLTVMSLTTLVLHIPSFPFDHFDM
jgi:hypothetical protein